MKRLLAGLICLALLSGCSTLDSAASKDPVTRTGYVLGTVVTIKLLDRGSEALLDRCFERLAEIESLMSVSIEGSDVFELNRLGEYRVSDDTFKVIKAGLEYGALSQGRFDISLGPVIDLWKIGTEEAQIPTKEVLTNALEKVDFTSIMIKEDNIVSLPPGARIDLGGIAKGYAADVIGELIQAEGVTRAIINLGGNIKVVGSKSDDTPFNIGIQGPDENRNDYLGIVEVTDKTVVTSGDYERYFIEDGVRYHHIFDAATGYPYNSNTASVTVITESSMIADALSTILFLTPIEEGIKLCASLEGVDCIYITKDQKIHLSSPTLEQQFTLTDLAYTEIEGENHE